MIFNTSGIRKPQSIQSFSLLLFLLLHSFTPPPPLLRLNKMYTGRCETGVFLHTHMHMIDLDLMEGITPHHLHLAAFHPPPARHIISLEHLVFLGKSGISVQFT